MSETESREDNVFMAKLAEQAERYDGEYYQYNNKYHLINDRNGSKHEEGCPIGCRVDC